jgi:hypothetical protein
MLWLINKVLRILFLGALQPPETPPPPSYSRPVRPSLSVCLSACISTARTGRISVKFRIKDFQENLSRKPKFV